MSSGGSASGSPALGLDTWFQPSVAIFRQGAAGPLDGDAVIQPGDMLWTDFGITYLGLNTDTQHLAYVLRRGERDAPAGLRAGLAAANRAQDAVTASFRAGLSGNALLEAARARAGAQGLNATHLLAPARLSRPWRRPVDRLLGQSEPRSARRGLVRPNTAWSIELNVRQAVPEWGGQMVEFRLEEDAYFDGRERPLPRRPPRPLPPDRPLG